MWSDHIYFAVGLKINDLIKAWKSIKEYKNHIKVFKINPN